MWGLHWTSGTVRMAQRLVHQKMVLLYPCAHASWTMCDLCCGVYQRTHICRIYIYVLCCAKLLQLCPALCNPVDCSPPGSSVHGMLQARILEWVSMPSSKGSSQPRDLPNPGIKPRSLALRAVSLLLSHQGSPPLSSIPVRLPFLCSTGLLDFLVHWTHLVLLVASIHSSIQLPNVC